MTGKVRCHCRTLSDCRTTVGLSDCQTVGPLSDPCRKAAENKQIEKYVAFLTLQGEARAIEAQLTSTGKGFCDLKAPETATLVRYEYAARDAKGASKVSSKAACVSYLDSLPAGTWCALISAGEPAAACRDKRQRSTPPRAPAGASVK
jgi:hypothetical protein